ncbi:MAG: SLBB domain-containing protein, partial [Verrucomicrobiota bacterium]
MKRMLACLFLLSVFSVYAEPEFSSPSAIQAKSNYVDAMLMAKKAYIQELKQALSKAMKTGDSDEYYRINQTLSRLETKAGADQMSDEELVRLEQSLIRSDSLVSLRRDAQRPKKAAPRLQPLRSLDTVASSGSAQRRLKRGEHVVIRLLGPGAPREEIRDLIDDSGQIKLPWIKGVSIAGRTTREAEQLIEKTYVDRKIFVDIEASVAALSAVAKIDKIYIAGEVRSPGSYPLSPNLTLSKAIIEAGGRNEFAGRRVQLDRDGRQVFYDLALIERGDAKDPGLAVGDKITVQKKRLLFN